MYYSRIRKIICIDTRLAQRPPVHELLDLLHGAGQDREILDALVSHQHVVPCSCSSKPAEALDGVLHEVLTLLWVRKCLVQQGVHEATAQLDGEHHAFLQDQRRVRLGLHVVSDVRICMQ